MNRHSVIALVLAAAMVMSGCVVTRSKYMEAVAEAEAAKADLEKVRAQKSALEQQVKSLKDANSKLSADTEFVSAELQRIKDSREKERASVETRVKELEQKLKELSATNRSLRQEYEDVKKHNESLKATVARYQKELKERERSVAVPTPPALPRPPAVSPPSQSAARPKASEKGPSEQPAASREPAMPSPPQAGLAPVNINTASASDLVLFLGLSKEEADRVIANRPYRVKGELVAKNVLPKATFDGLKERITVAQ